MNLDKIKFMGKYWEKGNIKRLYFRDINEMIGLRLNLKKDGNIQRAYLDGKLIAVREAKELDCRNKEFYYDLNLNMLQYTDSISVTALDHIMKALS